MPQWSSPLVLPSVAMRRRVLGGLDLGAKVFLRRGQDPGDESAATVDVIVH